MLVIVVCFCLFADVVKVVLLFVVSVVVVLVCWCLLSRAVCCLFFAVCCISFV